MPTRIRRSIIPLAVLVLAVAARARADAASPPALPKVDHEVLLDFRGGANAVVKAWQPMSGSPPVAVVDVPGGGKALRMPIRLKGTTIERASWDRAIRLDLACHRGVEFLAWCGDTRAVGHFSIYFHSGNGWYSASFSVSSGKTWKHVRVNKADTRVEGTPAGWGQVDRIRLSAWRGRDEDTELYLAAFGRSGRPQDAKVVLVRADAGVIKGEKRVVADCTQRIATYLDDLHVAYIILSDRDLTAARLAGKTVAVLPFNPVMSDRATEELLAFVKGGGKLAAFYVLPRKLQEAVGLSVGEHVRQKRTGQFAEIRPAKEGLRGQPAVVGQRSWNIHRAKPAGPDGRVAAWWFDDAGKPTGEPAVVVSDRAAFLTHILLGDDAGHKKRLLLAMLGHLDKRLWMEAAKGRWETLGRFGPYPRYDRAMDDLLAKAKALGRPPLVQALAKADDARSEAEGCLVHGDAPSALALCEKAARSLRRAYCLAQTPQIGEFRAIWCHSAFGVEGLSWDEAIKGLADNGFTAVLPNMLWGGAAYYKSEVLPVAPDVADKGDQIALCAAACRKYGVACHVWKVNFNLGWAAPKAFVEELRKAGRLQVDFHGNPIRPRNWLCPSNPANRKLEIDSMVEIARKYPVAGLHFDYIRYPHQNACFCDGCRRRFEKELGHGVKHWPADTRDVPAIRAKWLDFRRAQITAVVAGVAEQARKVRPGIKLSAAVFRIWPVHRDQVGQDWKLWCEKGYLDFVCPMDYTYDTAAFRNMAAEQLDWAGNVPCYPGIGLTVWPDKTDVVKLIEQIQVTRDLKTGGFTVFHLGHTEATQVLPLLGVGMTRKQ